VELDGSKVNELPDLGSFFSETPSDLRSANVSRQDDVTSTSRSVRWRYLPWLLVALVILFQAFVRFRLREFPLERDEGEYAYAGQLILQGIPPYKLAYNMKLPGTYAAYAVIMALFGETTQGIHLGLLLVNGISIVLVFLLGRWLFDTTVGVVSAACYGVLSLSEVFLGLAAHATHFVVLPMLIGMLCLLSAMSTGRSAAYFGSGLLFGLAFLMKQQGAFFGLFGGAWIIWEELKQYPRVWTRMIKHVSWFGAGCALPFVLVCVVLLMSGVFGTFWFWTFLYAREYVSEMPFSEGKMFLWEMIKYSSGPFWTIGALAVAGLILLWWRRLEPSRTVFVTAFLLFSFLTVCPGFYFREHYFITLLPAVALLAGVGVSYSQQRLDRMALSGALLYLPGALAFMAVLYPIWWERATFFTMTPVQASREVYAMNPFPESLEVARYIRANSATDARVAVIGSEPQIYFYSRRHSATGFIYAYGLVEEHRFARQVQNQMIHEIELVKPEFFVIENVPTAWAYAPNAPRDIFTWTDDYTYANYDLVGIVDLLSPAKTEYHWDQAAVGVMPRSQVNVLVFKRKPAR
jgi:hypothetical protein